MYSWQIFNLINDSTETGVQTSEEVSLHDRELVLPSNTLTFGLKKLVVMVTVMPYGISKSVGGYVRVREPNLVALIDCGHVRTVSRAGDVILNASRSYDPGNPTADSSTLSFKWFCVHNGNTSWLGQDVPRNSSILRIPSKRLNIGEYDFQVHITSGRRKASTSQKINVIESSFPTLCMR
jgi:hypothetical protein